MRHDEADEADRAAHRLDGLAVASVIATVLLTPAAIGTGGSDLLDPRILLIGAAVGLLSSVIPYSCELVALRSVRPSVFSILMSLEPAIAAVIGLVALHQVPDWPAVAGIALVVAASAGVSLVRRRAGPEGGPKAPQP